MGKQRPTKQHVEKCVQLIHLAYSTGKRIKKSFIALEKELSKEGESKYSNDLVGKLADEFNINTDLVRKRMKLVDLYSPQDLENLFKLMRKHSWAAGESSIIRLLAVPNPRTRNSLQRTAAEQGWSRLELNHQIRIKCGTRKQGGRSPRKTRSGKIFKAEIHAASLKFIRLIDTNQTIKKDGTKSLDHLRLDTKVQAKLVEAHKQVVALIELLEPK